jgi:mannose-1-phosphate guanylyltransferase
MQKNRYAVILAGGQGKRFWPLSTRRHPKQLLSLLEERTLLQMAVDRIRAIIPLENILVLTNQSLVEASRAAAPDLPPENIVGEPVGRDTAPAVALAGLLVEARDPEAVFAILTADQVMEDIPLFQQTLSDAAALAAERDVIVTIGIQPSAASTSFGYIETGAPCPADGATEFLTARRFVEKPDAATAAQYLQAGNYLWNAGMFIWSLKTLQQGLRRHAPVLAAMVDRLRPALGSADFMERVATEYAQTDKISIDYALLEKSDNIVVARGVFAWDDLGSWPALAKHIEADADGNVLLGDARPIDSAGNIVFSKDRLTALIGVEDLVVVQAPGVTLVCPKERAQDIKAMVDQLEAAGGYDEVL